MICTGCIHVDGTSCLGAPKECFDGDNGHFSTPLRTTVLERENSGRCRYRKESKEYTNRRQQERAEVEACAVVAEISRARTRAIVSTAEELERFLRTHPSDHIRTESTYGFIDRARAVCAAVHGEET